SVSVLSLMPLDGANRQLVTQLPTAVGVTLRGSRAQIDGLHAADVGTLLLDLRDGKKTEIELEAPMFDIPTGLSVEQIIPPSIKMRWDDVVTRSIPVQVPHNGDPAAGLALQGIKVEPREVEARGPRLLIQVMQFARTEPIDITNLGEGSTRRAIPLDRPPNLVTYKLEGVSAVAEVTRKLVKRPIGKLKVEVIGLTRATTNPTMVTVVVTGSPDEVNALSAESIVPRVEPKAAGLDLGKPGSANLPVLVEVARAKVEIEPASVVVKW
ncbi:MAG: CdaR family protein, partial [Minicystis sp.]